MKLTLSKTRPEAAGVTSFIFEADRPVSWTAGQYLHYTLPHPQMDDRKNKRWFTISAAPSEGHIMVTTRFAGEKSSSFKRALFAMQPGDVIEAEGPEGDFVVSDTDREYIFIAGGIGITPFRSILVDAKARGVKLHVTLLYANRDQEIPFKQELEDLAEANPDLKVRLVVAPAKIDQALLKPVLGEVHNPLVYVSGPEPMVEAMEQELKELGVPEDSIVGDFFPGYTAV